MNSAQSWSNKLIRSLPTAQAQGLQLVDEWQPFHHLLAFLNGATSDTNGHW